MLQYAPSELVLCIVGLLRLDDLCNFRLVCHRFAKLGQTSLVEKVTFFGTRPSLQRLEQVACHNGIASGVTTLIYEPLFVRPLLSYRDWKSTKNPRGLQGEPQLAAYERYQRASADQQEIWESDLDYQIILRSCHILPNLKHLTVGTLVSSERRYPPKVYGRPGYAEEFCQAICTDLYHERNIPRPPRCLLKAIQACSEAGMMLETLTVYGLSWKSLIRISHARCLKNLQSLSIVVEIETSEDQMSACKVYLGNGELQVMLSSLKLVRLIRIEFLSHQRDDGHVELRDVFGDITWPLLQQLEFGGMQSSHAEFQGLLLRHQNTLQYLALGDILLVGNRPSRSWKDALSVLGELRLTRVDLRGRLSCMTVDGPCTLISVLWLRTTDEEYDHAATEELRRFAIRPVGRSRYS